MTFGERIEAALHPSPKVNGYGSHACGCSWDSGPYDLPCAAHDVDRLRDDVFLELTEAAREVLSTGTPSARLTHAVRASEALRAPTFKPGP